MIVEVFQTAIYIALAAVVFLVSFFSHLRFRYTEYSDITRPVTFLAYTVLVLLVGYFLQFL